MTQANQYELYMLDLINAERTSHGLDPLQLEQSLNQSADAHSAWMLQQDVFSHTGAGGSSAHDRMVDADFDFAGNWQSAENIAIQTERGAPGIFDDIQDLHDSLMNSPGHRANLLDPDLDYIGIGIDRGEFDFDVGTYDSVIVTQNFASTAGEVDPDNGVTPPTPADAPNEVPVPIAPPEIVAEADQPQADQPAAAPSADEPAEQPTIAPEPASPTAEAPGVSDLSDLSDLFAEFLPEGFDFDQFYFEVTGGGQGDEPTIVTWFAMPQPELHRRDAPDAPDAGYGDRAADCPSLMDGIIG